MLSLLDEAGRSKRAYFGSGRVEQIEIQRLCDSVAAHSELVGILPVLATLATEIGICVVPDWALSDNCTPDLDVDVSRIILHVMQPTTTVGETTTLAVNLTQIVVGHESECVKLAARLPLAPAGNKDVALAFLVALYDHLPRADWRTSLVLISGLDEVIRRKTSRLYEQSLQSRLDLKIPDESNALRAASE